VETQGRRRVARFILLSGVVVAAIAYAWGAVEQRRAAREIEGLEARCKEDQSDFRKKLGEPPHASIRLSELIRQVEECSARVLAERRWEYEHSDPPILLTSTQTELRDAHRDRVQIPWENTTGFAFWAAAVSLIPWLWYFALDRLRELSAAIQGRRE
jgi:hypothetical protein